MSYLTDHDGFEELEEYINPKTMDNPLTKKQIYEIAKMYIGSSMYMIDRGNVGDLETHPQVGEIVGEINRQGRKILGKRPLIETPEQALKYI